MTTPTTSLRAIIYTRVSTDEQAESGLGLAAQLRACKAKANELGANEILTFTDAGVSGSTEIANRPGLAEALAVVKRGDVVIVAKRDRVARDMFLSLSVERLIKTRKATFVSVAGEGSTNDVSGLVQRRMFDLFAEVEREMIRSRTKQALSVKKSRSERVGTIPFGYKLAADKIHLEESPKEQKIIARVLLLRKAGLSFREVVARLNKDRVPTRTGNPWQLPSVFNIVKSA